MKLLELIYNIFCIVFFFGGAGFLMVNSGWSQWHLFTAFLGAGFFIAAPYVQPR